MGQVSTIGLDTAKRVFQVHGVGAPHAPRARTNAAMKRPSNPLKFLGETLAARGTLSRRFKPVANPPGQLCYHSIRLVQLAANGLA